MSIRNIRSSLLIIIPLTLLALNAKAFECGLVDGLVGKTIHQEITAEAAHRLDGFNSLVFGMSQNVVNEIESHNWKLDGFTGGQQSHYYHFDDEVFHHSSIFLMDQREKIIDDMLHGRASEARKSLGLALHCLQDFYSHSSFIERGNKNGECLDILGTGIIDDPPSYWANDNVTCDAWKKKICLCCPWPWPKQDRCKCWTMLSWYHNFAIADFGSGPLTTGWVPVSWGALGPRITKVWHGFWPSNGGLNKDNPDRPNFQYAYTSAVNATEAYMKLILGDNRVKDNLAAIKTLLDDPGNFGVVCDNSQAMAPHFRTVMNSMRDLSLERGQSYSYLLQLFDYSQAPAPYTTFQSLEFVNALNNSQLSTSVGACPRALYQALLSAVAASEKRGFLYLFSNGQAEDEFWKYAAVMEPLVAAKQITICFFFIDSECNKVHVPKPSDDGGGLIFRLTAESLTNVTSILRSQLSGNIAPILSVSGTLATNTVKEFTVPVDSTVTNITFLVTVETNSAISFITPSGATLTNAVNTPCCTIWELGEGRAATVSQPQTGNWRIQFTGSGHFSVSANAATPIQLSRFGFWDGLGRPIPGQPTQVTNTAVAILGENYRTSTNSAHSAVTNVSWRLVTPSGDLIQSLAMIEDPTNLPGEWRGTAALPSQPFKVTVTGADANGYPLQRVFPQIFQIRALEVRSLQNDLAVLTPGVFSHVRYQVSNLGAAGNFNVSMSAGRAVITNLGPATMTLATGATNLVQADILLPAGTGGSALEYITLSVSRADDSTLFNGTVDEFNVGPGYAGDTTIISSNASVTFTLNSPEVISNGPAAGNLVLVASNHITTLDLNGKFETINGLDSRGVEVNTRVTSDLATTLILGDNDATGTFGGQIMKAVAVVKIGNGIQTLTGANTYTNNTTITSGALALKNAGSIASTRQILLMDAGALDVSQASGGWTLNEGQKLTGGGAVGGSVTAASGSWIEAGYTGSTLSFSNNLTLNSGTTNVVTDALTNVLLVLWASSTTNNAPIAVAGNLTLNGMSTVAISYDSLPGGRYRLITYGGTLTGTAAANLTLFCFPDDARQMTALDDSIPGEIDLLVAGLAGGLTWAGDAIVNNWDVTTTDWLNGASPDHFFSGDAVTFDDSGSQAPAVNLVGSLAPSSILVNAAGNYTFAGSGDLTAYPLIKTNSGTLTLANSGSDTVLQVMVGGGTMLVNGSLSDGSAVTVTGGTLGGTGTITGPVTIQPAATLAPAIWELMFGRVGTMSISGTLSLAGTTVMDVNKASHTNDQVRGMTTLTCGGTLVVTNLAGTLAAGDRFKLFDAAAYSGAFAAINPATPGIGIVWDLTSLPVNGTLAVVSSAGDKYKANNTLALNQAASWTNHVAPGSTNFAVWDATVSAGNTTNGLGADSYWGGIKILNPGGPVTLTSAGTLTLNSVSGTGIDLSGASQNLTLNCGVSLAAGQSWAVATSRSLTLSGGVAGSVPLTKSGFGTLTLSGNNTFTGNVNVNQGSLWLKHSNALGSGPKTVTCNNGTVGHCQLHLDGTGGNLALPSGINFLVSNWSDPGTVYNEGGDNVINGNFTVTSGGGGLIFLVNAGSLTLNGTIAANTSGRGVVFDGPANAVANGVISDGTGGSMFLLKQGAGTATLNAANTYTGTTEVRAGALVVNGSLAAASAVTVKTNATLGGTGTIKGPVTVQAAATFAPAIWELAFGRVGTMTISNTLSLAGTTMMCLNKAAATNDQVRGLSSVTYGGTLVVTNLAGTLAVGDTFKLFDAASYSNAFATVSSTIPGIGITWDSSRLAVDGTLRVAAVTPQRPQIQITFTNGQLVLVWLNGGTLQSATSLFGPWSPVPGAASPYPVVPTAPMKFYRLVFGQ